MIPATANAFLKKEGLQIAEASSRDYPLHTNQKRGWQEIETVQKKADFVCICPAVSKFAV